MIPRRHGHIINVASSSGKKPYATQESYCAAKAGVIALSTVMALELRPHNVRVCVVRPGAVENRLADEIHPTNEKTGWIQPQDSADVILYIRYNLSTPPKITLDELMMRRFDAEPM